MHNLIARLFEPVFLLLGLRRRDRSASQTPPLPAFPPAMAAPGASCCAEPLCRSA